jgi:hypothetical protein
VGRQHHARAALLFGGRGKHAAEAVGAERAAAELADEDRADRVLVAGRAVGLRIVFEQAEDFGETGRHGKKRSKMKEERWTMEEGGLEDQRAGGLEGNAGLAAGKMREVFANARPRE